MTYTIPADGSPALTPERIPDAKRAVSTPFLCSPVLPALSSGRAALDRLRAALIEQASDKDRRRLTLLCGARASTAHGERIWRCGMPDGHGGRYRCNRAPCSACAARSAARRLRRRVLPAMEHLPPAGLFHLTVVLQPTDNLWDVTSIFRAGRTALRNAFNDLGRRYPSLDSLVASGALEVGLVRDDELHRLGMGKRATLTELKFPIGDCSGPVWLPHVHALIWLPDPTFLDAVAERLRAAFPCQRQVHVQRLRQYNIRRQITRVIRYPVKYQLLREVADARCPWDREEVEMYAAWASEFSAAFRGFWFDYGLRRRI